MKKNLGLLLLTASFIFLPLSLFAQKRVIDNAGLLKSGEISELENLMAKIAQTYHFDLVIVTETNIGNSKPMDYADDYFDNSGYGLGKDRDGCLFLQITGTRDYWFSTSGRGIKILNSTAFNKLDDDVVKYLKDDNPAEAYRAFISNWEQFLVLDAKGKSYNILTRYAGITYISAWVVSFLIALGIVLGMKAKMNTVCAKKEANKFIIPGSLVFTRQQDSFLYCMVTKTARADTSSSSSSHTSSSGRSHGGGGGRY